MTTGIKMGNVSGIYLARITIDPASVATITTAEQLFTVPGVQVGDAVFVCKPTNTTGLGVVNARDGLKVHAGKLGLHVESA